MNFFYSKNPKCDFFIEPNLKNLAVGRGGGKVWLG